jgi:hypothetical protein
MDSTQPHSSNSASPEPHLSASPQLPSTVMKAIQLLWVSWALELGSAVLEIARDSSAPSIVAQVVLILIGTALLVWIIRKLKAHRNWARILYLCFSLLRIAFARQFLGDVLPRVVSFDARALLSVLDWVVCLAALGFLFTKDANKWFASARSTFA